MNFTIKEIENKTQKSLSSLQPFSLYTITSACGLNITNIETAQTFQPVDKMMEKNLCIVRMKIEFIFKFNDRVYL